MLLGVHVSGLGRIYEAPQAADALGCNTMQIFSRSPQMWRRKGLELDDIEQFKAQAQHFKIKPIFIHIPYLINLASPEHLLYRISTKAYIDDVKEAALLNADYIVTHMGSHKETSEKEGLKRLTKALNKILEKTAGSEVGILLENTSGSGSWLGYTFSHQQKVIAGIEDKSRIGLCLDTAHAYAAGYDLASQAGLDRLIDEIGSLVGFDYLKLIHLNDTKVALGSKIDRHFHIGQGNIGMQGMKRILQHPQLKGKAFILETPKDTESADKKNLALVRKLAK